MLNEILKWGFTAFVTIATKIFNFVVAPIFAIVQAVVPNFNTYFTIWVIM